MNVFEKVAQRRAGLGSRILSKLKPRRVDHSAPEKHAATGSGYAIRAQNRFVRGEWSDGTHQLSAVAQAVGDAGLAVADISSVPGGEEVSRTADKLADLLGKLAVSLPEAREIAAALVENAVYHRYNLTLSVPCPRCGVDTGELCVDKRGRQAKTLHKARAKLADRQQAENPQWKPWGESVLGEGPMQTAVARETARARARKRPASPARKKPAGKRKAQKGWFDTKPKKPGVFARLKRAVAGES